jgi:hypothetical protein
VTTFLLGVLLGGVGVFAGCTLAYRTALRRGLVERTARRDHRGKT